MSRADAETVESAPSCEKCTTCGKCRVCGASPACPNHESTPHGGSSACSKNWRGEFLRACFGQMALGWRVAFGGWAFLWFLFELTTPLLHLWLSCEIRLWGAHVSYYAVLAFALMASLLLLEILGKKYGADNGDTFSELVWKLTHGTWMAALAVGVGAALALRVASLPILIAGHRADFFTYGPWLAISLGMLVWLTLHFPRAKGQA